MEASTTARSTTATGLGLDAGRTLVADLSERIGRTVTLRGWVHHRRDLGGLAFLHLRDRSGVVQCVLEGMDPPLHESCIELTGDVVAHPKAPGGIEVRATTLRTITLATTPPPVEMAKIDESANPDTLLEYRHVTVRAPRDRAVLKVQAELLRAFRGFLDGHAFTEISTPKLVAAGAEGGAHQFEVDYYGRRAYLAQSPQLYKQIMVAVFERVYEVAPVYRAEPSHTVRHLAEYLSLDVEMGFIEDDGDVMDLQEALLKSMLGAVAERCPRELRDLGATLPALDVAFPRIPLLAARELVRDRYGHASGGKDLDPEAERLLGRWALEEHGADFVFVTHYP
jgi:nondiscriminating aspartyl-tRNA synthetase